jgi:hypothetical protein
MGFYWPTRWRRWVSLHHLDLVEPISHMIRLRVGCGASRCSTQPNSTKPDCCSRPSATTTTAAVGGLDRREQLLVVHLRVGLCRPAVPMGRFDPSAGGPSANVQSLPIGAAPKAVLVQHQALEARRRLRSTIDVLPQPCPK